MAREKGEYYRTYIIDLQLTEDEAKLLDSEKENICLSMRGNKIIIKKDCYTGKLGKIEEVTE